MLVKLKTFSLLGIDAVVKESTYRIERAIENSGYFNPIHRVVINLAPELIDREMDIFTPQKTLFR